ncbi:hypothetical protein NYE76_07730 [Paenibacillus sp. FSL M7-0831]|uniref:hypothetical protein n=2 Tax=Paenibacillus TaxID=44249 RepID=UPI001D132512|nr:hypothetical protein [Paenibacillus macerans]
MKSTLQDLIPHELGPAISVIPEDIIRFFGNHDVSLQTTKLVNDLKEAADDIGLGDRIYRKNPAL